MTGWIVAGVLYALGMSERVWSAASPPARRSATIPVR